MKKSYETPKEEVIGNLERTGEAIASYISYLKQGNKKNEKQVRIETEKLASINKAIRFIKDTCPSAPGGATPAPGGAGGNQ